MPPIAKIRINNSRNNTTPGGDNINSEILKELKNMVFMMKKSSSIGMSGFMGGTGGAVGAGVSIAALAMAADIAAEKSIVKRSGSAGGYDQSDYGNNPDESDVKEKLDGVEMVARVNDKTGQILEYMTMEEAAQKGILNDKNEIKGLMFDRKSKYQELNKDMDTEKDVVSRIISSLKEELVAQEAITEAKKKKAQREAGTITKENITSDSVFYKGAQEAIAIAETLKPKEEYTYKQYTEPIKLGNFIRTW